MRFIPKGLNQEINKGDVIMGFFKGTIFDMSEPSVEERLREDDAPPVRRVRRKKIAKKVTKNAKLGRVKHKSRPAAIKTDPYSVRRVMKKNKMVMKKKAAMKKKKARAAANEPIPDYLMSGAYEE